MKIFKYFRKKKLPKTLTTEIMCDRIHRIINSKPLNDKKSLSTRNIKLSLRSVLRDPNSIIN